MILYCRFCGLLLLLLLFLKWEMAVTAFLGKQQIAVFFVEVKMSSLNFLPSSFWWTPATLFVNPKTNFLMIFPVSVFTAYILVAHCNSDHLYPAFWLPITLTVQLWHAKACSLGPMAAASPSLSLNMLPYVWVTPPTLVFLPFFLINLLISRSVLFWNTSPSSQRPPSFTQFL